MFVACMMTLIGLTAPWLDVFALFSLYIYGWVDWFNLSICLSLCLGVPDFICSVSLVPLYILHSDTCICLLDFWLLVRQCRVTTSGELIYMYVSSGNQWWAHCYWCYWVCIYTLYFEVVGFLDMLHVFWGCSVCLSTVWFIYRTVRV